MVAWPLKRSVFARLSAITTGDMVPPAGAELLATGDPAYSTVQVSYFLPAEPDRLCVFGTPLRGSRAPLTAETYTPVTASVPIAATGATAETVQLEIRCRVYSPGEDTDGVDRMVGDLAQAVTAAVVGGPALFLQGSVALSTYTQELTAIVPSPEPSVTGAVSLLFTAVVVTT